MKRGYYQQAWERNQTASIISNQNGGIKKSCANMGQVMSDYHQVNEFTEASHRNEKVQQGFKLNYNQCMC